MKDKWQFEGPFSQDDYDRIQDPDFLLSGGLPASTRNNKYPSAQGIRSRFPRSTPKYVRYFPALDHEFAGTTARMYISVTDPDKFVEDAGKNQHTKAIARVLAGGVDGDGYPLPNSGLGYIDFLLQQANHQLNEKFQVIETLSDNYVAFFFGQSAPIFQYSGSLMNTYQDDWTINMLRLYQSMGRGSQLARRGVLFYLKYDSIIVSGSLLNFNWTLTGDVEIVVPFSFNFLVRKIHILYGGLQPPTDISDAMVSPSDGMSFWPWGYVPNESGRSSVQARINDDMGGSGPKGTSSGVVSNQPPPAPEPQNVPESAGAAPPPAPAPPTLTPSAEVGGVVGAGGESPSLLSLIFG